MFRKKNKHNIDLQTADKILQNVLVAVDAGPNNIPLEEIEAQNRHDYKTDTILLYVVGSLLAITILLPLLFKSATAFISVDPNSSRALTVSASEHTGETFVLTFIGPVVDVKSTYAETERGDIIFPLEYNRVDNTIVFPGFTEESNIYIYDVNGNCLHLLFVPHLLNGQ